MHLRRHMPLVLLIVWAGVDLAIVGLFLTTPRIGWNGSIDSGMLLGGLVFVHGSAVMAWYYLSDEWAGWHVASLIGLTVSIGACGRPPAAGAILAVLLLIAVAIVNSPLALLRAAGWRYRFHATHVAKSRRWQFSLMGLVFVTLAVALCLGTWNFVGWLVRPGDREPGTGLSLQVLLMGIAVWPSFIHLVVALTRSRYTWLAALALATAHLKLLSLYFHRLEPRQASTTVILLAIGGCALAAQAALVRWAGYRLVKDNLREVLRRQQRHVTDPPAMP